MPTAKVNFIFTLKLAFVLLTSVTLMRPIQAQDDTCLARLEETAKQVRKTSEEESKWIRKQFSLSICGPDASNSQREDIVAVLDLFDTHRITANKGLLHYLHTAEALIKEKEFIRWDSWHQIIQSMMEDKKQRKKIAAFLSASENLLLRDVLSSGARHEWQLNGKPWYFEIIDNKPMLRFDSCSVFAHFQGDTIRFENVAGQWDLTSRDCEISESRFPWYGTSFNPEATYAMLPAGKIDLDQDDFKSPNALFYSSFSSIPLTGNFIAKLEPNKTPDSKSYPAIRCTENNLVLDSLFQSFRYTGGLQVRGSQIRGISSSSAQATMHLMQSDTVFMHFAADEIIMRQSGWSAVHVLSEVHYRGDTLSHPDCNVRYLTAPNIVSVTRQMEGIGQQAFKDSHHQLSWDVEGFSWEIGQPLIKIGSPLLARANAAEFTSFNYFEKQAFDAIQGIDPIHPVVELYRFIRETGLKIFTTMDYSMYIKLSEIQARAILMNLANDGYIAYDVEDRLATVQPKTFGHMAYSTGKRDYDKLRFYSAPKNGDNATWSLINGFMEIRGVENVVLSSRRNVSIDPDDAVVTVKSGRDMVFNGRVRAGNIELNGHGLEFSYETFTIDFNKIEEVRLSINDTESTDVIGRPRRIWLNNALQDISGQLAIDHPTNRSGKKAESFPSYPEFTSKGTSFVYYDQPQLYEAAYIRDRFYYAVEPFKIEGLDELTRENLKLAGTLVSAGIVPDITRPLIVMPDNFLGMTAITPANGSELYGGAAEFTSTLSLDGSGLRGDGVVNFLNAHVDGEAMVFLPDSIIGSFANMRHDWNEIDNVPFATGEGGRLRFEPYQRTLTLRSGAQPIELFEAQAALTGSITVADTGMKGAGLLELTKASLTASDFTFESEKTLSQHAAFVLQGKNKSISAFATDDVQCSIDFDDRVGEFTPNSGETAIELPIQQYRCYMDKFRWFIDEDEIDLISDRDIAVLPINFSENRVHSNFISTHPTQDSLHFLSTYATYLVGEDIVQCNGVSEIAVADARIYPDSGRITIRQQAELDPLLNARVIANSATQHHLIEKAQIEVSGRYAYQGTGAYQYIDGEKQVQEIMLDHIFVDAKFQTQADGSIYARDNFRLSSHFSFAGVVNMVASEEFLVFDGGARMTQACDQFKVSWIKFRASIDPNAVAIPIKDRLEDVDGEPIACGVMTSSRPPFNVYPAFLDPLGEASDIYLVAPEGEIRFRDQSYVISTLAKYEDAADPGNLIALDVSTCKLSGSGSIDFPLNYGMASHTMVGNFDLDKRGNFHFRGTCMINYHFNKALFERMALQIPSWQESSPIDIQSTNYEMALSSWMGQEDSEALINDLAMTGKLKNVPKFMQNGVVLTNVDLVWDDSEEAWLSTSSFGLATLGKEALFMETQGKLELRRSRSGDAFTLYFHGDEENWYYHDYKFTNGTEGKMNVTTSDMVFYELLAGLKADKRRDKLKNGQSILFQYMASRRRRDNLVDTYRDFE